MGLAAPHISLTWAYQQRYSANMGSSAALLNQHGLISSATQPNMGLSAALLSQHGHISSATQPNMGLSAPPNMGLPAALLGLTWAYQHILTA